MREKPREKPICQRNLLNEFKAEQRTIWRVLCLIPLFIWCILDPRRAHHKKGHRDYLQVAMREK